MTSKRISLLFLLIFVALAVLIFRLSFLQLSQGQDFLKKAENNRYITQSIPAPRGIIFDRNKTELVRNKPAYTITFQKLGLDKQDPVYLAANLAPIFGMDIVDLFNAMDPHGDKYSLGMARKVVKDATPAQVAYVREHADELPGFNVVVEPVRDYVYGHLASHVIGYLNNIPNDYYNKHKDEGYQQSDLIGTAGVEKQYEPYLRGKNGTLKVEVNINYQPLNDKRTDDPVKGHDLVLTLDKHLQEVTEKALADRVKDIQRSVKTVKNASAVAINPKTGEVLAMASYPDYDPNMWIKGLSTKEYNEVFAPAEMNRAISQVYQPGSTVKMSTVLIGLKEGSTWPGRVIDDPGKIQVGYMQDGETPNYIRSWAYLGAVDPQKALAMSSNVYMIRTFLDLVHYNADLPADQMNYLIQNTLPKTMDKVLKYQAQFGLGTTNTGVDLPYESDGQITREGYVSDLAFAAIGQTEKVTLLQLASYTGTLANNGVRMQPHVVKDIIDPDGTNHPVAPKQLNKIDFTPDQLSIVKQGMYDVTHKTYGTFTSVFGSYPIPVAGKTGTAETGLGDTENSLFVGYAPYEDPQIAIAIIIPDNEHNSHSYSTLGPIAKSMFDAYFKLDQPTALSAKK